MILTGLTEVSLFAIKRTGRLAFFLAVGTTSMERGMAAPVAAIVSDGI
jgi:hypothetical protein